MIKFNIEKPDQAIRAELQKKIDNLTKPKGALGMLEELATQIGLIQQTTSPKLSNPYNIVFAADHGVAVEGVSLSPQEVTFQMISNFISGGAGVNFLARQHGFKMKIVDSGVNYDFQPNPYLVDKKIGKGTTNYLYSAAMSKEEAELAIKHGADVVADCKSDDCNIISFGEMGIGNTSSSAVWMSYFTNTDLKECVGAGCGLDQKGVEHKYDVLRRACENFNQNHKEWDTLDIISYFGGFEMVMAVGGMLKAAEEKMIILVDGFIMTSCMIAAARLNPEVLNYAVFGHQSDESGHKKMLEFLNAKPLLRLDFRLGEGTGAICAYPIVDSAVRMINEMNSFEKIMVTKYFD